LEKKKIELSQSLEDYLEAIYIVTSEKRIARVKDLVKRLKVRSSSVIGAIKKLRDRGYVKQEHYGYIELTPTGSKHAEELFEKHNSLFNFFSSILKVSPKTAEKDACAIEHHISEETYKKMMTLINLIKRIQENDPNDDLCEKLRIFISGGDSDKT